MSQINTLTSGGGQGGNDDSSTESDTSTSGVPSGWYSDDSGSSTTSTSTDTGSSSTTTVTSGTSSSGSTSSYDSDDSEDDDNMSDRQSWSDLEDENPDANVNVNEGGTMPPSNDAVSEAIHGVLDDSGSGSDPDNEPVTVTDIGNEENTAQGPSMDQLQALAESLGGAGDSDGLSTEAKAAIGVGGLIASAAVVQ